MANTIKGLTLAIGGDTSALTTALSGVNKQSKDLQSELKSVEKLLKLDPTNTELLAQKQKILADTIATTKSKLDTLKEAEKQAQEQFKEGKISEEQYRALQREVIKTEESLKDAEKQAKNFGDTTKQSIDKAAKGFEDAGNKINAMGKALAPVSIAAGALAAGMGVAAVKAGVLADDLNTLAKQTGLSTEEIQKFQYASDLIDVSLDTLTGSMAKLIKNMATAQKGSGDAKDAFEALGISIADSRGQLRNNQDVFSETIRALGKIENQTQRDAYAMAIFGKSAQDLNPLILGGIDDLEEYSKKFEELGLKISQDTLNQMNEFNDALDSLKATGTQTFSAIGAEIDKAFLPIIQAITPEIEKALSGFVKWIQSLDKGTLVFIGILATIVAGIAPLLMAIGQMSLGISAILSLIAKLSPALVGAAAANTAMSGTATTAAASTGILSGALSAISTFITGSVIPAITAFVAAGGWIPIVVLAAAAAITYLWDTNEGFRKSMIEFDQWITGVFQKDWSESFGNIGDVMNLLLQNIENWYEGVKQAFTGVIQFVNGTFARDWRQAWEGVKNIFIGVFTSLSSIAKAPVNAILTIINSAITGINQLIRGLNSLKLGSFSVSIPQIGKIPLLANGGILSSGSAIVGDDGAELLSMINGRAQVTPLTSGSKQAALAGAGTTYNYWYATIDAKNVREINDIVRVFNTTQQTRRR